MIQSFYSYILTAFSYEREMDALNMIREKKDVTELVFTNVHRTYAKRHGIIEHIEKKIKLKIICKLSLFLSVHTPKIQIFMFSLMQSYTLSVKYPSFWYILVFLCIFFTKRSIIAVQEVNNLLIFYDTVMSPDADDINISTVGGSGVTVYFIKSLTVNEMNNLWATALAREKKKKESSGKLSVKENAGNKRMRDDDDDEQQGNTEKKPRVVWTKEMHQKFLEAVAQLGEDSKIILDLDSFSQKNKNLFGFNSCSRQFLPAGYRK